MSKVSKVLHVRCEYIRTHNCMWDNNRVKEYNFLQICHPGTNKEYVLCTVHNEDIILLYDDAITHIYVEYVY